VPSDPQTMADLLEDFELDSETLRPLSAGESVEGIVAGISGDEVLVDLGGRSAGVASLRDAEGTLEVGEQVVALVVQPEGPQGHAVLSLRRARPDQRWRELAQKQTSGEVLRARVLEANRGGVVVDVGLRGFVPLSQLASVGAITRPEGETATVPEAVRAVVGKELSLRVIEVDAQRNRLILSEKAAVQELRRARKAKAAAELKVGDIREGVVTHISGFGMFVDVGSADGLVHRSEITWDKGVNPLTLHKVGDTVRVVVTAVDAERDRISLSIRRLLDDPWTRVGTDYVVGQDVDATVTRTMPFGAFARIAEGLEGLIHSTELAGEHAGDAAEALRVGDRLRVRIVAIDPERRRLSLSVRQAGPNV
jgi:small subunit ribosomal protein S1